MKHLFAGAETRVDVVYLCASIRASSSYGYEFFDPWCVDEPDLRAAEEKQYIKP